MIKVKTVFDRINRTYTSNSKVVLFVNVKGVNQKFTINGFYAGILETGQRFIAVHNRGYCGSLPAVKFADFLKTDKLMWDKDTLLIYDNSVTCNLITAVRYNKYSVDLYVDLNSNVVMPKC